MSAFGDSVLKKNKEHGIAYPGSYGVSLCRESPCFRCTCGVHGAF